jgi:asparagine synthase (glutamine-hydrolysing)
MCGITGLFHTDGAPVSSVILKKMTDAIAHRGPDGEGHFVDGGLGLGHRRLSIIDLSSAGHQPMASEDGRYVIAYNGEVYNFNELRIELEAVGPSFPLADRFGSGSQGARRMGRSKALLRFNGMFALAFWDKHERKLLLARDRYGIKPLYYACIGSSVVFGSEVKAILASGECRVRMNKAGLLEYMTFQNFFTDRTLFKTSGYCRQAPTSRFIKGARQALSNLRNTGTTALSNPKEKSTNASTSRNLTDCLSRLFHGSWSATSTSGPI